MSEEEKVPKPPLPRHLNILSLDRGVRSDIVSRLEEYYPKFMRDLDLVVVAASYGLLSLDFIQPEDASTLGDLTRRVLVVDFDLDNPKIRHNLDTFDSSKDHKLSEIFHEDKRPASTNPSSAALLYVLSSTKFKFTIDQISILSVGGSVKAMPHLTCMSLMDGRYLRMPQDMEDLSIVVDWLKEYWI